MAIRRGKGLVVDSWFDDNLVRVVGDGSKMFFWLDVWMEGERLCDRFRRLFDLVETWLFSMLRCVR